MWVCIYNTCNRWSFAVALFLFFLETSEKLRHLWICTADFEGPAMSFPLGDCSYFGWRPTNGHCLLNKFMSSRFETAKVQPASERHERLVLCVCSYFNSRFQRCIFSLRGYFVWKPSNLDRRSSTLMPSRFEIMPVSRTVSSSRLYSCYLKLRHQVMSFSTWLYLGIIVDTPLTGWRTGGYGQQHAALPVLDEWWSTDDPPREDWWIVERVYVGEESLKRTIDSSIRRFGLEGVDGAVFSCRRCFFACYYPA